MFKRFFLLGTLLMAVMSSQLVFAQTPVVVNKNANNGYAWPMLVRRATILKTPTDLGIYKTQIVNTPLQIVKFGDPLPEKTNEANEAKKAREHQKQSIKKYKAQKMMCKGDSLLRTFYWEGKADKYVLTIYNAEATNSYIVSNEQAAQGVAFTLSPGKYTWTVAPLSETGVDETLLRTDSIYVENPFYLTNMVSDIDPASTKVSYSWNGNSQFYVLFIFEEYTKKIIASYTTRNTSFQAILPNEGEYSWALMGVNPYGYRNVVCTALGEVVNMNEDIDVDEDQLANVTRRNIEESEIIRDARDPESGFDESKPFYDILGRPVNKYYRGVVVQEGARYLLWY